MLAVNVKPLGHGAIVLQFRRPYTGVPVYGPVIGGAKGATGLHSRPWSITAYPSAQRMQALDSEEEENKE